MMSTPTLAQVSGKAASSSPAESNASRGQESKEEKSSKKQQGNWNLVTPTLGGKQFWTDQMVFRGWRIQKHCYTGHCRLLDPKNYRRAWGGLESCTEAFETFREKEGIQPLSGNAVILLHGLGRTRGSMARLAKHFEDQGLVPINIGYASTRAPISEHAKAIERIIGHLDGIEEIYFVGHSMGNIVWRYYLSESTDPKSGIQGDPRIQASVMIAPPNQGAYLARVLKPTGLFGLITGQSGKELASADWEKFSESLATPKHRFAIVAGKYNGNPLFRVDNDTTVSVEETRLQGASDFQVVDSMHATIMGNAKVIEIADRFFRQGYLLAEEKRNPLK